MTDDHGAERETLLEDLLRMQAEMETIIVPELIEPMLSIRLTMQQAKVLAIVMTAAGGDTVQSLAKTVGVSLATMSGIVDRLEAQGMIERMPDPSDNRVRRVVPTESGRHTMSQLLSARPQLSRPPLQRLALEDLRALTRGISALLAVVRDETGYSDDAVTSPEPARGEN